MRYDVVIVGAGPAGISCAIRLQKAGIKHCVIDKKAFPRHKLCGGLVTEKTAALIGELCPDADILSEKYTREVCSVGLYNVVEPLTKVKTDIPFRITDRFCFDDALVKYYISLGGAPIENSPVKEVDFAKKAVICDNGTYSYGILVAADGMMSMIRKAAKMTVKDPCFCLETESRAKFDDGSVGIFFNVLEKGYGWAFPTVTGTRIGFGNEFDKKVDYKKTFDDYAENVLLGYRRDECGIGGAFVPYGGYIKEPAYGENVAFVGDAAGYADPISGEGLYYAFLSSKLLADSIVGGGGIKEYKKSVSAITRTIDEGKRLKALFYSKPLNGKIMSAIARHPDFVKYYLDEVVSTGRCGYGDFMKILSDYRKKKKLSYEEYGI